MGPGSHLVNSNPLSVGRLRKMKVILEIPTPLALSGCEEFLVFIIVIIILITIIRVINVIISIGNGTWKYLVNSSPLSLVQAWQWK